jgi:hypothetical protein
MSHKNCSMIKMIDDNCISLNYASFLQRCWRKEIERAIKEVKNCGERTEIGKWFRRQWYIAQAVDRKRSLRTGQLARW